MTADRAEGAMTASAQGPLTGIAWWRTTYSKVDDDTENKEDDDS